MSPEQAQTLFNVTQIKSKFRTLARCGGTPATFAVSLIWISTVSNAALALLTQLVAARAVGPGQFGQFTAALTTLNIAALLISCGLPALWLKVFAEEGSTAQRWIRPSLQLLMLSSTMVYAALGLLVLSIGFVDDATVTLVLILSPTMLAIALAAMVGSQLQTANKFKSLAIWEIAPNAFRLAFVCALVSIIGNRNDTVGAVDIATGYCALSIALIAVSIFRIWPKLHPDDARRRGGGNGVGDNVTCGETFRATSLFGASSVLYLICYQIDIVMLFLMAGAREAGLYGAAYLVVGATYTLPGSIFLRYLNPKLHRWNISDRHRLRLIIVRAAPAMACIGLCISMVVHVLAPTIVSMAFGEDYQAAVAILLILIVVIPIKFASIAMGAVLTSGNALRSKLCVLAAAAALNVSLNIALIPVYGAKAAAWNTVLTEAVVLLLLSVSAWRRLGGRAPLEPDAR